MAASYHQNESEILEELQWIAAAQRNPESFDRLYDKYFEQIFNYIYRKTDEEHLAADLTSQTFLQALQHIKKYRYQGVPFSAWLYRIATNEVNKHYRRSKKKYVFSLEEEVIKNLVTDEDTDEELSWQDDRWRKVITELEHMSTGDIMILELRFFESCNFKEIAYILDISESSAKMRTYRALEKLKRKLTAK